MFIEPKITYSEFMVDNPTFWDERLSDGDIDEATVASIGKWFKYRIVCDDFRFDDFFDRQLDLVLPRYNKLIRLENTEFDALVNIYRERQVTDTGSESGTESNSIEKEGIVSRSGQTTTVRTPDLEDETVRTPNLTEQGVRTPNLTVTENGETSSSSNTDTTSHNEGETTSTGTNDTSSVSKQNPQSISYGASVAGQVPALDWSYPSSQQQTHGTNSGGGTSESDGTGSTDTSQSGTSENTQTTTGTDTNVNTTTGTDTSTTTRTGTEQTVQNVADGTTTTGSETGSKDSSLTKSNLKREIFTGRDSLTPQDALREAMSYVKQSSAFAWLKEQLEVCFLSVYDI